MSTRSLICQKINDQYKTIYCHYDGYPSHQLKVLRKYYSRRDLEKTGVTALDKLLETRLSAINDDGTLELGMNLDKKDVQDKAQFFNKTQLLEYATGTNAEYIYDDEKWHVVNTDNPLLRKEKSR